jgi:flavin-binding protein dodecin
MASTSKGWEDAISNAAKTAGKTFKVIHSVYIQVMSANVNKNKIVEYRVNVKLTFEVVN